MRFMMTLALLAVTFLGGYYVGLQPDSPDVFTWAEKAYGQVSAAVGSVAEAAGYQNADPPQAAAQDLD